MYCSIHLRAISQWMPKLLFCMMTLKIIILELLPHLTGANKLNSTNWPYKECPIGANAGVAMLVPCFTCQDQMPMVLISKELQWPDLKIRYQDYSPSNGLKGGGMPYYPEINTPNIKMALHFFLIKIIKFQSIKCSWTFFPTERIWFQSLKFSLDSLVPQCV